MLSDPKFVHFHAICAKFWSNSIGASFGLPSPLHREILDLPLRRILSPLESKSKKLSCMANFCGGFTCLNRTEIRIINRVNWMTNDFFRSCKGYVFVNDGVFP